MKTDKPHISQDALYDTLAACRHEWQNQQMKTPYKNELLLRFMHMELKSYIRMSFLGLCICLAGSIIFSNTIFVVCGYMFLMGSCFLFEIYRRKYYQTQEIMAPVYLNDGRVLLFKMAGIAVWEIVEFIILCLVLYVMDKLALAEVLLYGFLPIFILQSLLIVFMTKLNTLYKAGSAYVLSFGIYVILIQSLDVLLFVNAIQLLVAAVVSIILYYLMLLVNYRMKTRRTILWN